MNNQNHMIQLCSGVTHGGVLNGELYATLFLLFCLYLQICFIRKFYLRNLFKKIPADFIVHSFTSY